jgi:hypothetical protein
MGLTWDEASKSAKDRKKWRDRIVALCPTRDEETNMKYCHSKDFLSTLVSRIKLGVGAVTTCMYTASTYSAHLVDIL